jgi:hypothetical protein
MTGVEDLLEDDYRKVLEAVAAEERWKWDDVFSEFCLDMTAELATDRVVEGRFVHSTTDGVLYFRMPDLTGTPGCAYFLLEQPFDPDISADTGFIQKLGTEVDRLVRTVETSYVSTVENPHTVLSIDVPVDYSLAKVETAGSVAASISEDVAELHRDICDSVDVD